MNNIIAGNDVKSMNTQMKFLHWMVVICALIQVEYAFQSADLLLQEYSREEYCEFRFCFFFSSNEFAFLIGCYWRKIFFSPNDS